MLFVHPLLQCLAIVLAVYVLWLGWQRTQSLHLHRRGVLFQRHRHVFWGRLALLVLVAGLLGGFTMAWWAWESVFVTGWHARLAVLILPLAIVGYATGSRMERVKKRRAGLPVLHGVNNGLLVLLALLQMYTGWRVLTMYGIWG